MAVFADPDEKTAKVVVPDYQLSLAIGKEGQNARLAARLTGYKIDIKSETQAKDAPGFRYEDYEDEYEEYEEGSMRRSIPGRKRPGNTPKRNIGRKDTTENTRKRNLTERIRSRKGVSEWRRRFRLDNVSDAVR